MISSSLAFAKKIFSSSILNGTGVSNDAHRITGASRITKQFSVIREKKLEERRYQRPYKSLAGIFLILPCLSAITR